MAPRRMDKVQLDVALPPAGGKKSNFSSSLKCVLDTILNHIKTDIDLLDEDRAMARTRQVRMRARHATARTCLLFLFLSLSFIIISYFGRSKTNWQEQDRPQSEPMMHLVETMTVCEQLKK